MEELVVQVISNQWFYFLKKHIWSYGKSGDVRDGLQRRGEGGLLHTVVRAGDAKVSGSERERERERERFGRRKKRFLKNPHGRSGGSLFRYQLVPNSIPISLPSCSSPLQELSKNWTSIRAWWCPVIEADEERVLFSNGVGNFRRVLRLCTKFFLLDDYDFYSFEQLLLNFCNSIPGCSVSSAPCPTLSSWWGEGRRRRPLTSTYRCTRKSTTSRAWWYLFEYLWENSKEVSNCVRICRASTRSS